MNNRIKILVRRNLKLSEGKIAAQSVHAALKLQIVDSRVHYLTSVVVLQVSDKKYQEKKDDLIKQDLPVAVVNDAGYTEVKPGTETCMAFIESEDSLRIIELEDEQEAQRPQEETG